MQGGAPSEGAPSAGGGGAGSDLDGPEGEASGPVDEEANSDLANLWGGERMDPRLRGMTAEQLIRALSARADVSACVPARVRRALALYAVLTDDWVAWRAGKAPDKHKGWYLWRVTAAELVAYLRTGAGRWRSRLYALDWDGWYSGGRLVRSLVHFALMHFKILLADFDGAWVDSFAAAPEPEPLPESIREPRRAIDRLQWRIALRNVFYVMAVVQLVEECGGDPEDIVSEFGNPTVEVYKRATRLAKDYDNTDFAELEKDAIGRGMWLNRRRNMNDALRRAGLGGAPARDESLYVPALELSQPELLRRAVHGLGMRSIERGPVGNSQEYPAWRAHWVNIVGAKAKAITAALVTNADKRIEVVGGVTDGCNCREVVRNELEGRGLARNGYFERMVARGEMADPTKKGAA